ncbi:MAG: hypothetical protein WDZ51_09710 [Pirellulaceae bacterium]
MQLSCPHCSTVLEVAAPAGSQVQCPTCQGIFIVPGPAVPAAIIPESQVNLGVVPLQLGLNVAASQDEICDNADEVEEKHSTVGQGKSKDAQMYLGFIIAILGLVVFTFSFATQNPVVAVPSFLVAVLGCAIAAVSIAWGDVNLSNSGPLAAIGCGGGCLLPILGVVALLAFLPHPRSDLPDEGMAEIMAKGFVRNSMKSPASANFGSKRPTIVRDGLNTFTVSGQVDGQNAFGATIRNHWSCTVRYVGDGQWVCVDLKMS